MPVEAGTVEQAPGHEDELRVALPADLPDGVYTVSWRVVSEADGHASAGAFSFGVNVAPGTVVTPSVPCRPRLHRPWGASPARSSCTWGWRCRSPPRSVGLFAFGGVVPERKRVLRVAAAAAVVGGVTMLLSERATLGVSMGDLLSSATGTDYLWLLGGGDVRRGRGAGRGPAVRPDLARRCRGRRGGGHARPCHGRSRRRRGDPGAPDRPAVAPLHGRERVGGRPRADVPAGSARGAGPRSAAPVDEVRAYSSLAGYALAVVLVTGLLRANAGGRRPVEAVRRCSAARTEPRSTSRSRSSWC